MPATTAPDTELVTRAAGGDRSAFAALLDRYADEVHDHVARWSRDAALAADATRTAFVALLDDLDAPQDGPPVLVRLLRAARERVIEQLQVADRDEPDAPIATAALVTTPTSRSSSPDAAALSRDTAERVWRRVERLDERTFTALDLHVRRGFDGGGIAAVMDATPDESTRLVDRAREQLLADGRSPDPLTAYRDLADVRAPVPVRSAVMATADEHFGTTPTSARLRQAVPVALALVVLAGVIGVALGLRSTDAAPEAGPPTAAGEIVPSPSPSPTPESSPTPTLETLGSPSAAPVPSPEPSVPVASPSPTPDATPTPTAQPLTVQVERPAAGSAVDATSRDELGRPAAVVPVAATPTGGTPADLEVTWTSSQAPGEVLLAAASGELLLWLSSDCSDTVHEVTATATDGRTGASAARTVEVLVRETCVAVSISSPAPQSTISAALADDGTHEATLTFAGEASDDVDWAWATDPPLGAQFPAPEGASRSQGQTQLVFEDCQGSTTFTLIVDVEGSADGSSARDEITLDVDCTP